MKNYRLVLFCLLGLSSFGGFSQHSYIISLGIPDGIGFGLEHPLKKNTAIEISASTNPYYQGINNNWNGGESTSWSQSISGKLQVKRYLSKKKDHKGLYFAGYVNYSRNHWQRQSWEKMNSSQKEAIQRIFDSGSKTAVKENIHKTSLGVGTGFLFRASPRISIDIRIGLGFSPPPLYRYRRTYYFHPNEKGTIGPHEWFGYLNHFTPLGGICFHLHQNQ